MYDQEKLFTLKEAAHFLNISRNKLRTFVKAGLISSMRIDGDTFFRLEHLASFLHENVIEGFVGKASWNVNVDGDLTFQGGDLC